MGEVVGVSMAVSERVLSGLGVIVTVGVGIFRFEIEREVEADVVNGMVLELVVESDPEWEKLVVTDVETPDDSENDAETSSLSATVVDIDSRSVPDGETSPLGLTDGVVALEKEVIAEGEGEASRLFEEVISSEFVRAADAVPTAVCV